jgi:integrase
LAGIPLQTARQTFCSEVSPVIQAGKNPRIVVTLADRPTVERLFQSYIDARRKDGTRTVDEIERVLLTGKWSAADGIGRHREAGSIEATDISAHLENAYARGARRQADIERTCMAAAFSWAIKSTHDYRATGRRDWGIKFNPVSMVPRDTGASKARERNLTTDELRQVWIVAASGRFSPEVSGAVLLLIACGQRVRETLRACGSDFDMQAGLWAMPAATTKGGKKPHTVPLPQQAIDVVRGLIAIHGSGPLFASRAGAATAFIKDTSLQHAMRRWSRPAGVADFQTKDLRRTWKSRTGEIGIDRFTRDLIQQHAKGDTGSKHYDLADYLPQMREAMRKWGEWLENILQEQNTNVAA